MLALNDAVLRAFLDDDVPCGDLTTTALAIDRRRATIEFRARQTMTVCASEEAVRLLELTGACARLRAPSGTCVEAGELLLDADGEAGGLHHAWKTAQTLVEWASGIATSTAAIVAAANGIAVACTRKNVPGTKALSAKAVRAGGGILHRLGLSETLLVFGEHRLFLEEAATETVARLRRLQPEKSIVVEVATVDESKRWADAGADVIQLEKFTPDQVARCRLLVTPESGQRRPRLAAAGGVRADNAAAYAAAGADFLVTSAPYWAPPMDVQVVFRVR